MSTAYRTDLSLIFDPDLRLPINGQTYRIASPTKRVADELRAFMWRGDSTQREEREWIERLLGDALDAMDRDGVPDVFIAHAGRTALFHFGADPKLAAAHWNLGRVVNPHDAESLAESLQQIADRMTPDPATPTD